MKFTIRLNLTARRRNPRWLTNTVRFVRDVRFFLGLNHTLRQACEKAQKTLP